MSILERSFDTGAENGAAAVDGVPARVVLQPIAAPSVLGLYGLAGTSFVVGAWMAGWYGSAGTPEILFPFAALFGGLAQFLAAMWSYRARDVVATAMHGTWGAFWMAYGVLYALAAAGTLTLPTGDTFAGLGMWFVALAAITGVGAIAALAQSLGLFAVLTAFTGAAALGAIAYLAGSSGTVTATGYVFLAGALLAWYEASAMLLAASFGRVILPLGKYSRAENVPGARPARLIQLAGGEPGVTLGQ
jgi:succinate-acetate transporter protein